MVCLSADAIEDEMNARTFDKSLMAGRSAIWGLNAHGGVATCVERFQQPGYVTVGRLPGGAKEKQRYADV